MNYRKIYADFIADRRSKQPEYSTYFEIHHITPKSLGGSDHPDNLIRLTPEDHYFAHICLAKIYGGRQWGAVWCMAKMTIASGRGRSATVYGSRHMVGVAKKRFAEAYSKSKKGQKTRDIKQKYTIKNLDGRECCGPLVEISEKTGVSLPSLSRLVSGLQGKTHTGWYFSESAMLDSMQKRRHLGAEKAHLVAGHNAKPVRCIETGQVFSSVSEANRQTGLHVKNALRPGRAKAGNYTWEFV